MFNKIFMILILGYKIVLSHHYNDHESQKFGDKIDFNITDQISSTISANQNLSFPFNPCNIWKIINQSESNNNITCLCNISSVWGNNETSLGRQKSQRLQEWNCKLKDIWISDITIAVKSKPKWLYTIVVGQNYTLNSSNSLTGYHLPHFVTYSFQKYSLITSLDLGDNRIGYIDGYYFSNYTHLKKLILKNNQITWISERAFEGLNNLNKLDLSRNQLYAINSKMFLGLPKLQRLNLAENPFIYVKERTVEVMAALRWINLPNHRMVCDCKLRWILTWTFNSVQMPKNLVCGPFIRTVQGKSIKRLKKKELKCDWPINPDTLVINPAQNQILFVHDTFMVTCTYSTIIPLIAELSSYNASFPLYLKEFREYFTSLESSNLTNEFIEQIVQLDWFHTKYSHDKIESTNIQLNDTYSDISIDTHYKYVWEKFGDMSLTINSTLIIHNLKDESNDQPNIINSKNSALNASISHQNNVLNDHNGVWGCRARQNFAYPPNILDMLQEYVKSVNNSRSTHIISDINNSTPSRSLKMVPIVSTSTPLTMEDWRNVSKQIRIDILSPKTRQCPLNVTRTEKGSFVWPVSLRDSTVQIMCPYSLMPNNASNPRSYRSNTDSENIITHAMWLNLLKLQNYDKNRNANNLTLTRDNLVKVAWAFRQCLINGTWANVINDSQCSYASPITRELDFLLQIDIAIPTFHQILTRILGLLEKAMVKKSNKFLKQLINTLDVIFIVNLLEKYLSHIVETKSSLDIMHGETVINIINAIFNLPSKLLWDAQMRKDSTSKIFAILEGTTSLLLHRKGSKEFTIDTANIIVQTIQVNPVKFNGLSCVLHQGFRMTSPNIKTMNHIKPFLWTSTLNLTSTSKDLDEVYSLMNTYSNSTPHNSRVTNFLENPTVSKHSTDFFVEKSYLRCITLQSKHSLFNDDMSNDNSNIKINKQALMYFNVPAITISSDTSRDIVQNDQPISPPKQMSAFSNLFYNRGNRIRNIPSRSLTIKNRSFQPLNQIKNGGRANNIMIKIIIIKRPNMLSYNAKWNGEKQKMTEYMESGYQKMPSYLRLDAKFEEENLRYNHLKLTLIKKLNTIKPVLTSPVVSISLENFYEDTVSFNLTTRPFVITFACLGPTMNDKPLNFDENYWSDQACKLIDFTDKMCTLSCQTTKNIALLQDSTLLLYHNNQFKKLLEQSISVPGHADHIRGTETSNRYNIAAKQKHQNSNISFPWYTYLGGALLFLALTILSVIYIALNGTLLIHHTLMHCYINFWVNLAIGLVLYLFGIGFFLLNADGLNLLGNTIYPIVKYDKIALNVKSLFHSQSTSNMAKSNPFTQYLVKGDIDHQNPKSANKNLNEIIATLFWISSPVTMSCQIIGILSHFCSLCILIWMTLITKTIYSNIQSVRLSHGVNPCVRKYNSYYSNALSMQEESISTHVSQHSQQSIRRRENNEPKAFSRTGSKSQNEPIRCSNQLFYSDRNNNNNNNNSITNEPYIQCYTTSHSIRNDLHGQINQKNNFQKHQRNIFKYGPIAKDALRNEQAPIPKSSTATTFTFGPAAAQHNSFQGSLYTKGRSNYSEQCNGITQTNQILTPHSNVSHDGKTSQQDVNVLGKNVRVCNAYMCGYGIPIVLCCIALILNSNNYGVIGQKYCFLVWDMSLWAFYLPSSLLLIMNALYFIMIVCYTTIDTNLHRKKLRLYHTTGKASQKAVNKLNGNLHQSHTMCPLLNHSHNMSEDTSNFIQRHDDVDENFSIDKNCYNNNYKHYSPHNRLSSPPPHCVTSVMCKRLHARNNLGIPNGNCNIVHHSLDYYDKQQNILLNKAYCGNHVNCYLCNNHNIFCASCHKCLHHKQPNYGERQLARCHKSLYPFTRAAKSNHANNFVNTNNNYNYNGIGKIFIPKPLYNHIRQGFKQYWIERNMRTQRWVEKIAASTRYNAHYSKGSSKGHIHKRFGTNNKIYGTNYNNRHHKKYGYNPYLGQYRTANYGKRPVFVGIDQVTDDVATSSVKATISSRDDVIYQKCHFVNNHQEVETVNPEKGHTNGGVIYSKLNYSKDDQLLKLPISTHTHCNLNDSSLYSINKISGYILRLDRHKSTRNLVKFHLFVVVTVIILWWLAISSIPSHNSIIATNKKLYDESSSYPNVNSYNNFWELDNANRLDNSKRTNLHHNHEQLISQWLLKQKQRNKVQEAINFIRYYLYNSPNRNGYNRKPMMMKAETQVLNSVSTRENAYALCFTALSIVLSLSLLFYHLVSRPDIIASCKQYFTPNEQQNLVMKDETDPCLNYQYVKIAENHFRIPDPNCSLNHQNRALSKNGTVKSQKFEGNDDLINDSQLYADVKLIYESNSVKRNKKNHCVNPNKSVHTKLKQSFNSVSQAIKHGSVSHENSSLHRNNANKAVSINIPLIEIRDRDIKNNNVTGVTDWIYPENRVSN